MSKWIYFEHWGDKPKTSVWRVRAKDGDFILGTVEWFGRWRQYCFFPVTEVETVFERQCLRDIADFCEQRTRGRKTGEPILVSQSAS